MKILIVGSGGREHAIGFALARSSYHPELYGYFTSANPGLLKICVEWMIGQIKDSRAIADYAWQKRVDLVVVGPEVPLMEGIADVMAQRGIPCVGPRKALADLEGSKAILRDVATRYAPEANPRFQVCYSNAEITEFINEVKTIVVKPIGLTSGKGVKVMGTQLPTVQAAQEYASELLAKDKVVLLEECLVGEEFSQIVMTDGVRVVPMPLCQDAKYAFENNQGPMTGGMGVYTMQDHLLPFVSKENRTQAIEIIKKILNGFQNETGMRYHGFLYGQFMLETRGTVIVETNVRLGDPEAINVMALIKTDPVDVFMGMTCGLPETVEFLPKATVCKYLVPQNYPESVDFNLRVKIDERVLQENDTQMIYAGVEKEGEFFKPTGSRFSSVLAVRDTVEQAEKAVEATIEKLSINGLRHRRDIATAGAINKKVERMKKLLKS